MERGGLIHPGRLRNLNLALPCIEPVLRNDKGTTGTNFRQRAQQAAIACAYSMVDLRLRQQRLKNSKNGMSRKNRQMPSAAHKAHRASPEVSSLRGHEKDLKRSAPQNLIRTTAA